jgi:hypothetical protein
MLKKKEEGKLNEKSGRKRVKEIQNREELRQKSQVRSRRTMSHERGKYNFQKGTEI